MEEHGGKGYKGQFAGNGGGLPKIAPAQRDQKCQNLKSKNRSFYQQNQTKNKISTTEDAEGTQRRKIILAEGGQKKPEKGARDSRSFLTARKTQKLLLASLYISNTSTSNCNCGVS